MKKIFVITHKNYDMPKINLYLPLEVGTNKKTSYKNDNTGNNISEKNPYFCELTGIYWVWKNLKCDVVGFCHYRRYFSLKKRKNVDNKFDLILKKGDLNKLLKDTDIILPKKRNYFIESVYSHYKHTMYIEPFDITADIIKEKYPEYYKELKKLKFKTKTHLYNMFIMKRKYFDEYCSWLFDILFELEKRTDKTIYNSFHARYFGRISERLLDVWINVKGYKYKEIDVIQMEKVDWFKKIWCFLKAKFFYKKYNQ